MCVRVRVWQFVMVYNMMNGKFVEDFSLSIRWTFRKWQSNRLDKLKWVRCKWIKLRMSECSHFVNCPKQSDWLQPNACTGYLCGIALHAECFWWKMPCAFCYWCYRYSIERFGWMPHNGFNEKTTQKGFQYFHLMLFGLNYRMNAIHTLNDTHFSSSIFSFYSKRFVSTFKTKIYTCVYIYTISDLTP